MIKYSKKLFAVVLSLYICLVSIGINVFAEDKTAFQSTQNIEFEYDLSKYDFSNGLPSNTVNAVAQSTDGTMWFGTDKGLVRYNSESFEKYAFEGLDSDDLCVTALECDSSGCLWVGTEKNGLFRLENGKIKQFDTLGYLSEKICAIECGVSANIIVAAGNGIASIDCDKLEITNICDELTAVDKSLADISVGKNGLVWCVTENSSVYFIANGVKATVDIDGDESANAISDERPISIYACDSGKVYVGTASDEIICLEPCDDGSFDSGVIRCTGVGSVFSFVEDSQSRVWICTDKGIGYVENDRTYTVSSSLAGIVNAVFCDSESSLWFASEDEGALQLGEKFSVNISASAGMGNKLCNCVAVYNNLLYIGTNDGLSIYDALNDSSIIENELTTLLQGVKINCLIAEENGNLLIGTDEKYGFIRYNAESGRSWSIINSENGLSGNSVYALCTIDADTVACATENGVDIIENSSVSASYSADFVPTSLEADESGKLYASSESGAYMLENGKLVAVCNELSENKVYDICAVDESSIVISADCGLYIYADSKLTDVSKSLGENSTVIDVISCGDMLYLVASNTVYSTSFDGLDGKKNAKDICGNSGLGSAVTFNSKSCIMNNVLYTCTIDGVVAIKTTPNEIKPTLSVNAIYCDGKKVHTKNGKLKIDSDVKTLEIDTCVLSFLGDNEITYILEGFDSVPRTISADENIIYTSLDGGKYNLKIYGTSMSGQKTEILTIDISKKNIWYESAIFWIVVVIATAIISFLVSMFFIVEKLSKEESLQSIRANLSTESIMALSSTVDSRSNVSKGHSNRVAAYSLEIARRLKCDDDFKESLYLAALLHDIGNIAVSDEVLKKPHKLTPEEVKAMQYHVEIGHDVLKEYDALRELADAVLYHHERYDGMGYSKKLSGDDIPLSARILFASESLDAMQTEKPYRPKLTRERIINEFTVGSGTQFDPEIASVVIKMIEAGFTPE